jgi:hypothetical protein
MNWWLVRNSTALKLGLPTERLVQMRPTEKYLLMPMARLRDLPTRVGRYGRVLLTFASLGWLSACATMYLLVEATPSSDPNLNPKSKFALIVDPALPPEQQHLAGAIVAALRQAGAPITDDEHADYLVHLQFTSSPEEIYSAAAVTTMTAHGVPSGPVSIRSTSSVGSQWIYLRFLAYRKADIAPGRVKPVWMGQITASSHIISGREPGLAVALFRHLGEPMREKTPVQRQLGQPDSL